MGSRGSVIFALVFAIGLVLVSGQYPLKDGKCPNFNECRDPVEFREEKIYNMWHTKYSISFFFQIEMKCSHLFFVPTSDPTKVVFEKTEYDNSTNNKRFTEGTIAFDPQGNLDVRYTDLRLPFNFTTLVLTSDTWVLLACYECDFFGHPPGIYGYVFSRLPFSCDSDAEAAHALDRCGVPISAFHVHDQVNCQFC